MCAEMIMITGAQDLSGRGPMSLAAAGALEVRTGWLARGWNYDTSVSLASRFYN